MMCSRKLKEIRDYIFADKENLPLEHRIFLAAIVVGILISSIGWIINFMLDSSAISVIIPLLLSVLLMVIYYFVRFKNIVAPFVTPIIIVAMIESSVVWIFNGGINGSNIMTEFIVLILGILVVPNKYKKYIMILFITLNIFILLIQFFRPDLITSFPSETDRWVDNIITFIYSSFFIYIIIRFVHKNYTLERLKVEESEIKLQKLNADKDRFIVILGHDLKNPVNNLLGLSEVLIEDLHKVHIDQVEILANQINSTARSTNKLLEDILMWARTQQDSIAFNPQILSFRDICISTLEILDPIANSKNITINYSAQDEITIYADIDKIKTILLNLISNAIKFTNKGGTININAEGNSGNVLISVSDNGIGISDDNLTKLFEIAQVITTKGTEDEKGSGLGLLICKEFVENHGGKIWVESVPGKGSTFHFTVPNSTELKDINVASTVFGDS